MDTSRSGTSSAAGRRRTRNTNSNRRPSWATSIKLMRRLEDEEEEEDLGCRSCKWQIEVYNDMDGWRNKHTLRMRRTMVDGGPLVLGWVS